MFTVFGNHTDLVSWTPEPHRRGSFGILSSCIVTISLCVWTALHLNIPHYSDAKRHWFTKRLMWRKLGWLCLGLLAPEMVAYSAWDQYRQSKRHATAMSALGLSQKWGMVQAFYAVMGGFVVDLDEEALLYPRHTGRRRLTLTPAGVEYIARHHPALLPQLREEEVKDKSKANALAKLLVCMQAGWFILQCITRMSLSLPITLLELNTLGHSVCALIVYMFWWNKPLDIEQPTPINASDIQDTVAFLCMTSKDLRPLYRANRSNKAETYYLKVEAIPAEAKPDSTDEKTLDIVKTPETGTSNATNFERTALSHTLEQILELVPKLRRNDPRPDPESTPSTRVQVELEKGQTHAETSIQNLHEKITLYGEDIRRWTLAAGLLKTPQLDKEFENTVVRRSRNWPTIDLRPGDLDWKLSLALNASSVLYGGLHALAWNADFINRAQQHMWRLASSFVICFVPLCTLVMIVEDLLTAGGEYKFKAMTKVNKFMYRFQIWQIFLAMGLGAYMWARVYLVVESFISLGHSPAGVYDLPSWSSYVPHIT